MAVNPKLVYELDAGWGFDGATFDHYFETAHIFSDNSASNIGVEKVRMYGKSYGLASLDLAAAGIETDFSQEYHSELKDLSLPPYAPAKWNPLMKDATVVVDHANWGLGIKMRVKGTQQKNLTSTEPSHVCQVLVLHVRAQGAQDA